MEMIRPTVSRTPFSQVCRLAIHLLQDVGAPIGFALEEDYEHDLPISSQWRLFYQGTSP